MIEEPTAWELLLLYLMVGGTVTLVGGAVVLSLVGLVVWALHLSRGRRASIRLTGADVDGNEHLTRRFRG